MSRHGCLHFKYARKRVCTDFVGGNKHKQGRPGKHCVETKMKTVRVCSDFAPQGHGELSSAERRNIKQSVHKGKFGGSGVMKSIDSCKAEVRREGRRGVPSNKIIKRLTLIKTWNKNKNPELSHRANSCMNYARSIA